MVLHSGIDSVVSNWLQYNMEFDTINQELLLAGDYGDDLDMEVDLVMFILIG